MRRVLPWVIVLASGLGPLVPGVRDRLSPVEGSLRLVHQPLQDLFGIGGTPPACWIELEAQVAAFYARLSRLVLPPEGQDRRYRAARVLARDERGDRLLVDLGVADGVEPGAIAVCARNLVGTISHVEAHCSELVTLLSRRTRLPAVIPLPTGPIRAILAGRGGEVVVEFPERTMSLPAGAEVWSSEGLEGLPSAVEGSWRLGRVASRVSSVPAAWRVRFHLDPPWSTRSLETVAVEVDPEAASFEVDPEAESERRVQTRVLAVGDEGPVRALSVIEGGRERGFERGQPLCRGGSLVGVLDQVGWGTSTVRLVADPTFRLDVFLIDDELDEGRGCTMATVGPPARGLRVAGLPDQERGWWTVATGGGSYKVPRGLLIGRYVSRGDCQALIAVPPPVVGEPLDVLVRPALPVAFAGWVAAGGD